MLPFGDTPFEDYIKTRATANQAEFAQVLKNAEQRVDPVNYRTDKSKSPTLYIALRDDANAKEIDLSKFFPDINVSDIKILKKRNDILLKELYKNKHYALNANEGFGFQNLYMTDQDTALEIGLHNEYKMYENFTIMLDANYLALWLADTKYNGVRAQMSGAAATTSETRDAWNVNVSFVYSF